jgi:hypothetical protein
VAPPIEQMLWYYAKGKPKDVIELEGHLDVDALNRASDDELITRTEELLAKAKQQSGEDGETRLIKSRRGHPTAGLSMMSLTAGTQTGSTSRGGNALQPTEPWPAGEFPNRARYRRTLVGGSSINFTKSMFLSA